MPIVSDANRSSGWRPNKIAKLLLTVKIIYVLRVAQNRTAPNKTV